MPKLSFAMVNLFSCLFFSSCLLGAAVRDRHSALSLEASSGDGFDDPATPPTLDSLPDVLTILNANTFLLEIKVVFSVSSKPNMEERSEGFVSWFRSLSTDEVPDVVVFEEIMSNSAKKVIHDLCTNKWYRSNPDWNFTRCEDSSHFEYITSVLNPTGKLSYVVTGGVVVLVKKGIEMLYAEGIKYNQAAGADAWAQKGFWAVKLQKAGQPYWVLATHTQAYEGQEKVNIRLSQFKQMRDYMDEFIPQGERVIMVGDMNIFTAPIIKDGVVLNINETAGMLEQLGRPEVPASPGVPARPAVPARTGELFPKGFWRSLEVPIEASVDVERNHYIFNDAEERALGDHKFDWILTPSFGDTFTSPIDFRYQYVPMKADKCFDSALLRGKRTDDLSDHYAVYAELCYDGPCPEVPKLKGHKGKANFLPYGPNCPLFD